MNYTVFIELMILILETNSWKTLFKLNVPEQDEFCRQRTNDRYSSSATRYMYIQVTHGYQLPIQYIQGVGVEGYRNRVG